MSRITWILIALIALGMGAVWFWPNHDPAAEQELAYQQQLQGARQHAVRQGSPDSQLLQRARQLPVMQLEQMRPHPGDWDVISRQRVLRVAVPYSRTYFFQSRHHTLGLSSEMLAELESYLNNTFQTGDQPVAVLAVPMDPDQLLPAVTQGLADLAMGDITITAERLTQVDFIGFKGVEQHDIVIGGPRSPAINTLADLAGRVISVRRGSPYLESLNKLNERLSKAHKQTVEIRQIPDELDDADLLDMLNAGLVSFAVMDDRKARLWRPVYPQIQPWPQLRLSPARRVGWAIRKDNPLLARVLMGFGDLAGKEQEAAERFASYQHTQGLLAPARDATELNKVNQIYPLLARYGQQYHFDPLLLLATGYALSGLDQQRVSADGPVGVMQVMPTTGDAMQAGNIHELEGNLHTATKYLAELRQRHFTQPGISERNQMLFALAAYRLGPVLLSRMRDLASARGLDDCQWFGEVEWVIADELGNDTVQYMRNILKYYVLYDLLLNKQQILAPTESTSETPTSTVSGRLPAAARS